MMKLSAAYTARKSNSFRESSGPLDSSSESSIKSPAAIFWIVLHALCCLISLVLGFRFSRLVNEHNSVEEEEQFFFSTKGTVKQDEELNYNYCVYDSDISTGYGVGAFFSLMASQSIVMVASRCFCCGKALSPSGSRALAVILFIIVWVFFFIAEVCLLAGSVRNAYHTKYMTFFGENPPSCETVRKGVFAAGAAFTFFTAVISQIYYIYYSKARGSFNPYNTEAGVNMAAYK